MSSPLAFIAMLRDRLRQAGVRFAITSGQACVYYGIQQTTKDSDWIIAPEDLEILRVVLGERERTRPWRAAYRSICGAPLEACYLKHGWTSHLVVTEVAEAGEHHVDIFGKAPRIQGVETDADDPDFASRHVVAQMKKTDRDKDWPMVFACGQQMWERGDWRGVLHFQDAEWLTRSWSSVPEPARGELIRQRPLLALIDDDAPRLRRAIAIERLLWVSVNKARYTCYQRAWKQFYRSWRSVPGMQWPLEIPFPSQHEILYAACQRHALPTDPLDDTARQAALTQARADAAEIMAADPAEIDRIMPPPEVLLP